MEQQVSPKVAKLDALRAKIELLIARVKAPVAPVPMKEKEEERKSALPRTRDLEREIRRERQEAERVATEERTQALEQLALDLFGEFDAKQAELNFLRFRKRNEDEEIRFKALSHEHDAMIAEFVGEIALYARWIAEHLDRYDEHRMTQDLIVRGVLRLVSEEEKAENDAKWQGYNALSFEERKSQQNGRYVFFRPPVFYTVRENPRDAKTAYYVATRWYPKEEWNAKSLDYQREYGDLKDAFLAHQAKMREEAADRKAALIAREAEDQDLVKVLGAEVDRGRTLEDVSEGKVGSNDDICSYPYLVQTIVTEEHEWRMHKDGRPLTGVMYIECLPPESDEIGQLQFMGATGGIRHYLTIKEVKVGQTFRYRLNSQFGGISDAATRQDMGFLRALFAATMGWKKSYTEGPEHLNHPRQKGETVFTATDNHHKGGKTGSSKEQKKRWEENRGYGGKKHKERGGPNNQRWV